MINARSFHGKATLMSTLQMQEDSFRYISNELHDNICHSLLLAIFSLQKANENEFQTAIQDSIHLLKNTLTELNDLSKTLNGEIIQSIGLKSAIQQQIDRLNNTKAIRAYFTITGVDSHLDSELELLLYRIIQEAISNVIKHAKASTLRILLSYREESVFLRIQDDGRGFDSSKISSTGAGLKNMRNRIQLVQGSLTIQSKLQHGCTIELLVSLQKPTL
jgi:two-component system NarL family sensor kinase